MLVKKYGGFGMEEITNYLQSLDEETREYFKILSPDFPEWLLDYINTPEMLRLRGISNACVTDYTKLYNHWAFYDVLEHSIGCALIVWNFTKDKKQTLSALFHDISTPVFKHCIDFLNGDYEKQESTEDLTVDMIKNSEEIMSLLIRDGLKLEEVSDYHIYPIADNDSPKLSSDRLEYTFMNGIKMNYGIKFSLIDIKEIYEDLEIQINEDGIEEICFRTKKIAEKFIFMASILWPNWCDNRYKITAQFFVDTVKRLGDLGELSREDLYLYSKEEVIWKMNNSSDKSLSDIFKLFQNSVYFFESDVKPLDNSYVISFNCKKRYINPLVNVNGEYKRIYDVSDIARNRIDGFLNFETKKYAYFDFNFEVKDKIPTLQKKLY